MFLAVDIGNTNIVFGLYDAKGKLSRTLRLVTKRDAKASYYSAFFRKHNLNRIKFTSVVVCSVVPQTKKEFAKFCKTTLKVKHFEVADNLQKLGIKIKIENPKEVGADRVVNAIAFYRKHKRAGIVIDFGTATTFDVVDGQGNYLGGMITPGINLALSALTAAAAKLPNIKISKPVRAIGTSSVSAMQAGIYFGYLGLIERCVKEISSELGQNGLKGKPVVVATGGLAGFFSSSAYIDDVDQNLTLEGLLIINKQLKENKNK